MWKKHKNIYGILTLVIFLMGAFADPIMDSFAILRLTEANTPVIIQFGTDEATSTAANSLSSYLNEKVRLNPTLAEFINIERSHYTEIFIIGHGTEQGLLIGENILKWEDLAEIVDTSPSSRHSILACQSNSLMENEKVILGFDGIVDAEVATSIAIAKHDLFKWIQTDYRFHKIIYAEMNEPLTSSYDLSFITLKEDLKSDMIDKIEGYYTEISLLSLKKATSNKLLPLGWLDDWMWSYQINLMSGNEIFWCVWGAFFLVVGIIIGNGINYAYKNTMKKALLDYAAAGFITELIYIASLTLGLANGAVLIDVWVAGVFPAILTIIFGFIVPLLSFFEVAIWIISFGTSTMLLVSKLITILTVASTALWLIGSVSDFIDPNLEASIIL